ncbi:hypothetical protein BKA65DRAFT_531777 [Rhexocercosporidium sp. MPI-PUGE-AT-0058]|nr:hypothetical protein BKA65DRAFT_531777 [Rhexocercosporidium sp. MPI-PUGE-AT-0058]
MGRVLRSSVKRKPPAWKKDLKPYDTPAKQRFFDAYARDSAVKDIAHFDIPVKPQALTQQLQKRLRKGRRYKQAFVKKEISKANKSKRVEYDEAHVDPSSMGTGYVLREEGTRENLENIQEKPKRIGNKLHMAGWVNWHAKCEKLEFYYDEEEKVVQPLRPRKPRARKNESPEQWEARILEWEASKPHPVEVKPKGNSMTQKYYVDRLLPVYKQALDSARARDPLSPWIL